MAAKESALAKKLGEFFLWSAGFIFEEKFSNWYNQGHIFPEPARTVAASAAFLVGVGFIVWRRRRHIKFAAVTHFGRGIIGRYAGIGEVEDVWKLCRSHYERDDHIINMASLQAFMTVNRRTARIFEKEDPVSPLAVAKAFEYEKKSVALCIVFEINKRAVSGILDGTIKSAQQLTSHHAARENGKPAGLYVTNICGTGIIARGKAEFALAQDLYCRLSEYDSIEWIFARKANDNQDGQRIISKYDFTKTRYDSPEQQIWKLSRKDFLEEYEERYPK